MQLRYTLLAEGGSDRTLIPILNWLLREHLPRVAIIDQWADFWQVAPPRRDLCREIDLASDLYPCELLFVHRDADRSPRADRVAEIEDARGRSTCPDLPGICVVPVRMTEAWLLFDESAIRRAAGNPNGQVALQLPASVESIPNPKRVLHEQLVRASQLTGRRRKRSRPHEAAFHVSRGIRDFSPLRGLTAFAAMEADVRHLIQDMGWAEQEED